MYCPNCGRTNSAEQRFCRSCGLSLEKIVESIAEQLTAHELDEHLRDRQRKVDRLLNITAGTVISIVVGAVLWGIIYEIIIVKGELLGGSLFLAFVVGLILVALLAVYRESLVKASTKRSRLEQGTPKAETTAELLPESSAKSIPSITEHTTELLAVEKNEPEGNR